MPADYPPVHSQQSGPKRALSSGGSFFVNPALRLAAEGRVGEAAASGPAMQVEGTLQPAPEGLRYTARRGSHVEFLEVKAPGMEKQTTFVETDVVDDTREIQYVAREPSVMPCVLRKSAPLTRVTRLACGGHGGGWQW